MAISKYHTYAARAASLLAAFSITAGCDNDPRTEPAKEAAEEQRWKDPVDSPPGRDESAIGGSSGSAGGDKE